MGKVVEKFGKFFAGAGAFSGLMYAFMFGLKQGGGGIIASLLYGVFSGTIGGYLLGLIVGGLWVWALQAADEVSAGGNPFKVGLTAASFLCVCLAVLDLIFFRGELIIFPLILIITTGSLDGTFWACPQGMYDCVEVGCHCFQN
jgi:hypothetical protein